MEIGGYLEFERYQGEEYHTGCLKLNTARNCLKYLIEARNINKLWLSRWNCSAVLDTCENSGIEIGYFDLDSNLKPVMPPDYKSSDYVYVVNYYGQVSEVHFEHMILDNVQAFFQKPIDGVDTIYTCRKYFGVTDGAYLYTDARIERELKQDLSWRRVEYLVGRFEKSGSECYTSYQSNEELLDFLPLERMSALTENILGRGKEVIACCSKETFKNDNTRPHFDLAQKSIVIYDGDDDLKERLIRRITATVK